IVHRPHTGQPVGPLHSCPKRRNSSGGGEVTRFQRRRHKRPRNVRPDGPPGWVVGLRGIESGGRPRHKRCAGALAGGQGDGGRAGEDRGGGYARVTGPYLHGGQMGDEGSECMHHHIMGAGNACWHFRVGAGNKFMYAQTRCWQGSVEASDPSAPHTPPSCRRLDYAGGMHLTQQRNTLTTQSRLYPGHRQVIVKPKPDVLPPWLVAHLDGAFEGPGRVIGAHQHRPVGQQRHVLARLKRGYGGTAARIYAGMRAGMKVQADMRVRRSLQGWLGWMGRIC
ncbi:hypothetical protein Vretifemale_15943, partial [Volvox reticuliferus]